MLAACGGGSSPPLAATGPISQASHSWHARPWISPAAKKSDLLYISDDGNYKVYIYSYPKANLLGTLDSAYGSPGGMCVDKSGNIFIAEFNGYDVLEYAHGGTTPIAVLTDPGQPVGCSLDPTSGNLAVSNEYGPSGGYGDIEIYTGAQGSPQTYYTDPNIMSGIHFCAYDNQGNLFVDGTTRYNQFALAELPKGSSAFTYIALSQTINTPGGIQWDGKYVALGDEGANPSVIYQLAITGSSATVVGTTTLSSTSRVRTFWIPDVGSSKKQGRRVIAPSIYGTVGYYSYPGGGSPTKTFSQNQPFAPVVSKGKK